MKRWCDAVVTLDMWAVLWFPLLVAVLVLSNAAVYLVFEGGDRHHLPLVPLIMAILLHRVTASKKEG